MRDIDASQLTEWLEDAFSVLAPAIERQAGLTWEEAHDRLLAADFEEVDTEDTLEQLLNRGYLYEVDDQVYATDPLE